jgi:translation initiation factor 1
MGAFETLPQTAMRLFAGTKYDQPPKCDRCGALETDCTCPPLPAGQLVRLVVEKRRKGKVVTVLRGLTPDRNDLPNLLSRLKSLCGAGGAIQEDGLEIQGAHVERIATVLTEMGYRVKS